MQRRANVLGLGLIGGSVAAALTVRGWHVSGDDSRSESVDEAVRRGLISAAGLDPEAEVTIIATPVLAVADLAKRALAETRGAVTDVGSTKATVCALVRDPRFVGGHPMAGSERDGLNGADPDMFEGAVWVLTPDVDTDDAAFAAVASMVNELGAEVIALAAPQHDELVAMVSHVPHLVAATLMSVASRRSVDHAALLRLAAGGFRDMTRIASGRPGIWLDICADNRTAILAAFDELLAGLADMRAVVADDDRDGLEHRLVNARDARSNLPGRVGTPDQLTEFRIPIPDRAGAAAEVFTLAAELGVNIADFEVVHRADERGGVAVVLIDSTMTDLFRGGLLARRFRPSVQQLS